MTEFAWLIEAPGPRYLGTREIGHYPEFFWTDDTNAATRFMAAWQADGVMMAVRRMEPALFAFAVNLGDARPTEHGYLEAFDIETASNCPKCRLEAASLTHRFCQHSACPVRDGLKALKDGASTDERWSDSEAETGEP